MAREIFRDGDITQARHHQQTISSPSTGCTYGLTTEGCTGIYTYFQVVGGSAISAAEGVEGVAGDTVGIPRGSVALSSI